MIDVETRVSCETLTGELRTLDSLRDSTSTYLVIREPLRTTTFGYVHFWTYQVCRVRDTRPGPHQNAATRPYALARACREQTLVYGDYIRLAAEETMQKSSSHRMREFRTALLLALGLALVSLGGAVLASTFVSH